MAGLIERAMKRMGYIKPAAPAPMIRALSAAQNSRLTESWTTELFGINVDLHHGLRKVRSRSRDLARNNDYAKSFLRMVKTNVVGPCGMTLQVQAPKDSGEIDVADSDFLESRFADWGKKGNCDITGRYSWAQLQKLFIETVARDGEIIIRKIINRSKYGFQLQLIDPSVLDDQLIRDLPGGNKVRLGVEYDAVKRPIAYWLMKDDPNDPQRTGYTMRYERVPAGEIWHSFLPEEINQLRGCPWLATPARRMWMLDGYEDAAMVAARVGAAKMGFWTTPDGNPEGLADGKSGDQFTTSAEAGHFDVAPPGHTLETWDPQYPHDGFAAFVKSQLRGISSALGVSYSGLANDLESVNFSSMRSGLLVERDVWIALQEWMIEEFCEPVYEQWLSIAGLTKQLGNLPVQTKFEKFNTKSFQGPRWPWVDPLKDVSANVMEIENGLKSRGQVIREKGGDPEKIWKELEKEQKRLKNLLPQSKPASAGFFSPNGDQNANADSNANQ